MTLSNDDKNDVRLIIQAYFDHFLEKTYPALMKAHIDGCPYGKKLSKFKWILIGAAGVLAILVPTVGKSLLSLLFAV